MVFLLQAEFAVGGVCLRRFSWFFGALVLMYFFRCDFFWGVLVGFLPALGCVFPFGSLQHVPFGGRGFLPFFHFKVLFLDPFNLCNSFSKVNKFLLFKKIISYMATTTTLAS